MAPDDGTGHRAAPGAHGSDARAVVVAFLANLGVAAAKLGGFLLTGSGSMLAEFAHSVADTGNQALLLSGRKGSVRPPDADHPFGYGAFRFIGAFLVALLLFGLGAVFSIGEGVQKLLHPHRLDYVPVALVILGVAALLEVWSFQTAIVAANQSRLDQGWFRFIRSTRIPELAVLLLEDSGALLGLLVAFVALVVTAATGDTVYDAAGSLVIGALLAFNSILLGIEMVSLLVGESASAEQLATIEHALASTAGISTVVHLRALHLGPEELLVGAKVIFARGMSADEAAVVVDEAEVAIRSALPTAHWIYIEPGVERPDAWSDPSG